MALSNSTKTFIIDPNVHNTSRCEFRIDDGMFITNLVLANVGVVCPGVTDSDTTGLYYNSVNGVVNCIKRLSVYSGGTLIDEIQELQAYASVQHLKTSSQGSEDLNRFEVLNGINTCLSGPDANLTCQATNKDYTQSYALKGVNGALLRHNNQIQVTNLQDGGSSGMLVLANYLQFLASVQVLPGIKDLKIVIEWNNDYGAFYPDPAATAPIPATVTVMRPQLVFTQLLDMKMSDSMKIPFTSVFIERFNVPAVAEGASLYSSFRSGAFRQRFVQNIVLYNQVTTNDDWMLKESRSVAQFNETIQMIWNGKKYLPLQGINSPAIKLRYFNDTMGSLNIPLASSMPGLTDVTEERYNLLDDKAGKLVKNFSVTAVAFNDVCDRLDIEVTRTGGIAADQKNGYTLLAFGTVSRLLTIVNGQVRLSY
jgi:hypothetical protein